MVRFLNLNSEYSIFFIYDYAIFLTNSLFRKEILSLLFKRITKKEDNRTDFALNQIVQAKMTRQSTETKPKQSNKNYKQASF